LKFWLNAMFILNFLVPVPHFVCSLDAVREFELNPGDGWEVPWFVGEHVSAQNGLAL
jgi:hypothetical protein